MADTKVKPKKRKNRRSVEFPMSVEKSKPATPRMLEDEDARRMERSKQLIEDAKKVIRKTRILLEQSRTLIKSGKKTARV